MRSIMYLPLLLFQSYTYRVSTFRTHAACVLQVIPLLSHSTLKPSSQISFSSTPAPLVQPHLRYPGHDVFLHTSHGEHRRSQEAAL